MFSLVGIQDLIWFLKASLDNSTDLLEAFCERKLSVVLYGSFTALEPFKECINHSGVSRVVEK